MTAVARPKVSWSERERLDTLREVVERVNVFGSFTWDAPSCTANTTTDTTLTAATVPILTGLRSGQSVVVNPPSSLDAGLVVTAWVPADDQLTIRIGNFTGGAINPASATWTFSGWVIS